MKNEISSIKMIESPYIEENFAMVMIPYTKNLTLIGSEGVVYSHKAESKKIINNYENDERKRFFPYDDIPTHYERDGVLGKKKCINQIIEYDKPYISVCNDIVNEYYLVKGFRCAYLCNTVLFGETQSDYYTRENLEKIYKIPSGEQKYIIHLGSYCNNPLEVHSLPSEEELLNDVDDSYNLKYDNVVIVKVVDKEISAQYVNASYIGENCYYVNICNLPINKYSLNQIRDYAINIKANKKPQFPLNLNPELSLLDVINAKNNARFLKLVKNIN